MTNVCSSSRVDILPDDVKPDGARRTPRARPRTGRRLRSNRLETGVDEQVEPGLSREEPEEVVVVDDARGIARLAQDHREVDFERRVIGVGVVRPLEVAEAAPVFAVVPALVHAGLERLPNGVWYEKHDATGRRVERRRIDHSTGGRPRSSCT